MRRLFEKWYKAKWQSERRDQQYQTFKDAYGATSNPALRCILLSIMEAILNDEPIRTIELEGHLKATPKKAVSSTPRRLTVVKKGKK